jgi:hypothetical protein
MADPNVVNIKSLPRVEEVVNGNLLLVENEQGTNTIDFENFVIGPNNASFYSQISNLSAHIISLSASATSLVNTNITSLSSTIDIKVTNLYTNISYVSSTIVNAVSTVFYLAGSVTIPAGQSAPATAIAFNLPSNVFINANDINLNFGSTTASTATSGIPYAYLASNDFNQAGTLVQFTPRLTFAPISTSPIILRWNLSKPYRIIV